MSFCWFKCWHLPVLFFLDCFLFGTALSALLVHAHCNAMTHIWTGSATAVAVNTSSCQFLCKLHAEMQRLSLFSIFSCQLQLFNLFQTQCISLRLHVVSQDLKKSTISLAPPPSGTPPLSGSRSPADASQLRGRSWGLPVGKQREPRITSESKIKSHNNLLPLIKSS